MKQLNYSEWESDRFAEYRKKVDELLETKVANA